MSEQLIQSASSSRLAPDSARTGLALVVALLALGGYAYSLARPDVRAALGVQSPVWWAEQVLILAQALVCLGIVARLRQLLGLTIVLTWLTIGFGVLHWLQALAQLHLSLPVTLLLNGALLWRLLAARSSSVIAPAG